MYDIGIRALFSSICVKRDERICDYGQTLHHIIFDCEESIWTYILRGMAVPQIFIELVEEVEESEEY